MPRFLSTRLICGLICPQMSLFNSEGKPQVELEIIQRRQMRVRDNEGTRGGNGAAEPGGLCNECFHSRVAHAGLVWSSVRLLGRVNIF